MKRRNVSQCRLRIALITCVMMLMITAMPPVTEMAFAETQGGPSPDKGYDWTEDIDEMLSAGEFREGVVFAGIDLRKMMTVKTVKAMVQIQEITAI